MKGFRALVLACFALTFVVVVVGAYVRLSGAGLGCPDWPLCYGRPLPAPMADAAAHAKAWKEMAHRYAAGTLGMWTVTMLLQPVIVTAHLLGGMAMLALLAWLALEQQEFASAPEARSVRVPALLALAAAHNAGAALLLASLVVLNFLSFRGLRISR
jgi:cytochrome c oxidase assembly protein subunit 15